MITPQGNLEPLALHKLNMRVLCTAEFYFPIFRPYSIFAASSISLPFDILKRVHDTSGHIATISCTPSGIPVLLSIKSPSVASATMNGALLVPPHFAKYGTHCRSLRPDTEYSRKVFNTSYRAWVRLVSHLRKKKTKAYNTAPTVLCDSVTQLESIQL